jgi:hypothetical protein
MLKDSTGRMKVVVLLGILLAGCAGTEFVSTGPDTYVVEKSGGGPGAKGSQMSADLYKEATAFCAKQKKRFASISVKEQDNKPFVSLAQSRLEFRCVAE